MSPSYLRPFLPSATLFQNQEIICRDGRDNRFPFFFPRSECKSQGEEKRGEETKKGKGRGARSAEKIKTRFKGDGVAREYNALTLS